MKEANVRRILSAVLSGSILLAATCIAQDVGEKRTTEESRKQLLENFQSSPLSTTPEDALLLRILIETRHAQRGIEVGTCIGFGAVNMGIGFERTGGHLDTIDIDPNMVKKARENIEKAGLSKTVTCIEGDALKVLPMLEGEYDFMFIDALKKDYLKYLQAVEAKLKPGAVIVADNTVKSAAQMKDFLDYVNNSPDYEAVTVRASEKKHDGMTIAYKKR
jgi:predicted O-methyltransferase YrrM